MLLERMPMIGFVSISDLRRPLSFISKEFARQANVALVTRHMHQSW